MYVWQLISLDKNIEQWTEEMMNIDFTVHPANQDILVMENYESDGPDISEYEPIFLSETEETDESETPEAIPHYEVAIETEESTEVEQSEMESSETADHWENWVDEIWDQFDGDGSNDLDMSEMVALIEHTFAEQAANSSISD